jgi:hypothetical protein
MTNSKVSGQISSLKRFLTYTLSALLSLQVFLFYPLTASAVDDTTPPTITSFTASASAGKVANEVGGIFYTNDTTPTISATYEDNIGGDGINATSAFVQVNGDSADFDSRDASGISATLPTLPEGTYAIRVAVSDNAINPAEQTKSLVIDTSLPSAPALLTPASITSNDQTPTISGTTEADSIVNIYDGAALLDSDNTTADGTFSISSPSLANGPHALTAEATDRAGNESPVSSEVDYTVDIVAPTIPTLTAEADTSNQLPTLDWSNESGTGAVSYRIQLDDDSDFSSVITNEVLAPNSFTPGSALANGSVYWRVASIDAYDNQSDFSATDGFVIDSNNPIIVHTNLPTLAKAGVMDVDIDFNETMDEGVIPTVAFGTSDPFTQHGTTVVWKDANTVTASVDIQAGWDNGINTVIVSGAKDLVGNTMLPNSSNSFYIDTIAPEIVRNDPAAMTMTIEAGSTYSEPGATWTDAHDGTGAAVVSGGVNTAIVGDYVISYDYTDVAGNAGAQVNRIVQVRDSIAPTISDITPANSSTTFNANVSVSGTFHDSGAAINKASLYLDIDGMPVEGADPTALFTGNTFTYTPTSAFDDGVHTVDVSIADNSDNRMTTESWSFTVTSAPTINSASASGGRIVADTINSTNTGFSVSGDVASDIGGQTVVLYTDGGIVPLASTTVLPLIDSYSIDLSPAEFASLSATDSIKNLQVMRIGSTFNHSVLSAVHEINVDKTLPTTPDESKIAVTQNASGADDTISGEAGAISLDSTTIILYDGTDVELGSYAVSTLDGSFGPISIGDNTYDTVKVATRDAAENESAKITKTNDIVAPGQPAITSPTDNTISQTATFAVTGTAEAGTTVTIYNDAVFGTGIADPSGNFSIEITLPTDGNYELKAKATDAAGNESVASDIVHYTLDRVAPTIVTTSPADLSLTNNNMSPISVTWSDATAGFAADPTRTMYLGALSKVTVWDGVDTMTYTPSSPSADGVRTVSATITDLAGNTGSVTFSFTIDTIAPIIAAHDNITGVEATSPSGAVVTYTAPDATDAHDGTLPAVCAPASDSTFPIGTTTVTCNKTDEAGNAAAPTTFTITVQDTTAPTISVDGDNPLTLEVHTAYVEPGATASDIVDGSFPATPSGAVDSDTVGVNTITYNATDAHLNSATPVTRTVNIVDTTKPVIDPHGDETAEATSAAGAVVSYVAPNTTDNYDATAPAICLPASDSLFPIGVTTVTCNKTDANGNVAISTTFSVTVSDTTAPTIDSITGSAGTTGESTLVTVNASDNVAPVSAQISFDAGANWLAMTGSSSPFTYDVAVPAGSTANIDYIVRVYDAADLNATSGTQTITVTDNDAPAGTVAVKASTITYISDPELYTRTNALKLTLDATDNIAPATMSFKDNASADWSAPVAYAPSASYAYTLSTSTNGTRTVYTKYCDAAGNCTETSDQIIRDSSGPSPITGATDGTYTNSKQLQFSWNATTDLPVGVNSGIQYYMVTVQKQNPDTTWSNVTGLAINVGSSTSYQLSAPESSTLTDGNYRANIQARDNAGTLSTARYSDGVVLDTAAPIITLGGVTPMTIERLGSYTEDGATWTDSVDGAGSAAVTGTVDTNTVGVYTIHYNYTDRAGNAATEVTRTVNVIDTTAPVLTEVTPVTSPTNNPHYVFNSTEAGTIEYSGSCAATTATTAAVMGDNNIALTGLSSGDYNACIIRVRDAAGNPSLMLPVPAFTIDVTTPVVTISSVTTQDSTPALSGTIDDTTATVSINVNGSDYAAVNNGAGTWTIADGIIAPLADGIYEVVATATDTLGNIGHDATSNELKIDNTAPTVISATPIGTDSNHRPTIVVVLSDPIAGINSGSIVIRINGIAITAIYDAGTSSFSYTPTRDLGNRTYNVTVDGQDNAGNTMTRYSFSFTIAS